MILKNVSVDCVIFGFDGEKLNVLLWQAEPEILKNFLITKEEYDHIEEECKAISSMLTRLIKSRSK